MQATTRCLLLRLTAALPLHAQNSDPELLCVRHIAPLFDEKCLACHGNNEAKIKGGLNMRTLASITKRSDSKKPTLTAGKPKASPIYLPITRIHNDWEPMPPKEADKLQAGQGSWIKDWIAGGTPWPDAERFQTLAKDAGCRRHRRMPQSLRRMGPHSRHSPQPR